jgi:molybdopterin converting factor subunit 1
VGVTILYFAALRDLVGRSEEKLALPDDVASVAALALHLSRLHPQLADRLSYVRFARNEEFARPADTLVDGDVVALIPPVAGG